MPKRKSILLQQVLMDAANQCVRLELDIATVKPTPQIMELREYLRQSKEWMQGAARAPGVVGFKRQTGAPLVIQTELTKLQSTQGLGNRVKQMPLIVMATDNFFRSVLPGCSDFDFD